MKIAVLLLAVVLCSSVCLAKDRVYQPASVLSMENRKVGEREYGITAHRIVQVTANVYRIQWDDKVYEIEPRDHDPLGARMIGQTIEVSPDGNRMYVRAANGKKMKEFEFKIVGAYSAKLAN